jgi:hypothetical protein
VQIVGSCCPSPALIAAQLPRLDQHGDDAAVRREQLVLGVAVRRPGQRATRLVDAGGQQVRVPHLAFAASTSRPGRAAVGTGEGASMTMADLGTWRLGKGSLTGVPGEVVPSVHRRALDLERAPGPTLDP